MQFLLATADPTLVAAFRRAAHDALILPKDAPAAWAASKRAVQLLCQIKRAAA